MIVLVLKNRIQRNHTFSKQLDKYIIKMGLKGKGQEQQRKGEAMERKEYEEANKTIMITLRRIGAS